MNSAPETEKTAAPPTVPVMALPGVKEIDAAMQEFLAPGADRVAVIAKYPFLVPILNQN